ncbi:MAG: terminase [Lachnospiraceae bacterium]|nr:terminase [Lachnospiraceae bacterium]
MDERNIDAAENDYMLGMKYKDIAAKYGVTINTVKSWKQRYGWSRKDRGGGKEGCAQKEKKCAHKKQKVCTQNQRVAPVQPDTEIEEVPGVELDGQLSEKQRLFCLYYIKYRNQVKAYQKAFQCSYENACRNAYTLGKNREVQKEIDRVLDELHQDIRIDIKDLIQQQIDIARADINDFVDISSGSVCVRQDMDGTLVKEIKETKEGISIKLYDKQKAIEFLKNNLPDETSGQAADNMQTLAEIVLNSRENRRLEDYE